MSLILCGYKCCGKTTLGKYYGQRYNVPFVDVDHRMMAVVEKTHDISALYNNMGETAFRHLEEKTISSLKKQDNSIIATGGGALLNKSNVAHLKTLGKLIYLKVDKHILYERLAALPVLPAFINKNHVEHSIQRYLNSRDVTYESVADEVFVIKNERPERLVMKLHEYRRQCGQQ